MVLASRRPRTVLGCLVRRAVRSAAAVFGHRDGCRWAQRGLPFLVVCLATGCPGGSSPAAPRPGHPPPTGPRAGAARSSGTTTARPAGQQPPRPGPGAVHPGPGPGPDHRQADPYRPRRQAGDWPVQASPPVLAGHPRVQVGPALRGRVSGPIGGHQDQPASLPRRDGECAPPGTSGTRPSRECPAHAPTPSGSNYRPIF